jgi:MFS family permease
MSPLLGLWVDKRSARHLVALGAISMGSGLIIISQAGALLQIWVVYATLIPLGVLSLGMLPSSALISRWFRKRRGLALGISLTGSSIGGFIAPPLLVYLFAAYGWRIAVLGVGISVICLAPVFYKVLANYPEDIEMEPEEEAENPKQSTRAADIVDWRVKDLLRTPAFYLQTLISGSLLAVTLGLLANLSLHAKDLGVEGQQTAFLYSIIAFCSLGGKIGFGSFTDRFGIKVAAALTIALMASGLLIFLSFNSYPALVAAALVVGLATGGVSPVWTSMIARGFGAKSFGRALGLQNPMHIPLTAPSAPIAGYISDTTGSYDLVFVIYLGLTAVAATALFFLRQPEPKERPGEVRI